MIDIASVLKEKEHVNIEVKSAGRGIPNSIWDTYSSFANTFGGTIILGIEEDKATKAFILKGIQNQMPLFILISMDDVELWSIRNFVKL